MDTLVQSYYFKNEKTVKSQQSTTSTLLNFSTFTHRVVTHATEEFYALDSPSAWWNNYKQITVLSDAV